MKKLILTLLFTVLAFSSPSYADVDEKIFFGDWEYISNGFWGSAIKTSYLNNGFELSLAIGCQEFRDNPVLSVYTDYSGYEWEEIIGIFLLTIKDLESGNVENTLRALLEPLPPILITHHGVEGGRDLMNGNFVFSRTKTRFKSGTLLTGPNHLPAIIQSISEGSDISIHFNLKGKQQKVESNWQGKNSFNKVLNKLNQSCQLSSVKTYKEGDFVVRVRHYDNGRKKKESRHKDGKQEGLKTYWYKNGQKESEANYKDDKREGLETYWHDNGRKMKESRNKDDKQEGLETFWHDNGRKKKESRHKDGKQEGLETYWYKNGQKESETNYKDDKQEGLSTEWDKEGKVTKTETYKDGELVK